MLLAVEPVGAPLRGDRNDFIVVAQETLDEWLHDARFPRPLGKLPPRPYLTVRSIAGALANGGDGLLVQESLLRLGYATVTGAFRERDRTARRRRRVPPVIEDAKALLSARLRLKAALERLAAGDEDVAAIARAVGFSSHSHLTASFRRAFGVQPSRIRRKTLPPFA
jgi:Helix-turn-helix domain